MQFSVIALFALVGAVTASPSMHNRPVARQAQRVDVAAAAMADANGNIIPFDAANVYKGASNKK